MDRRAPFDNTCNDITAKAIDDRCIHPPQYGQWLGSHTTSFHARCSRVQAELTLLREDPQKEDPTHHQLGTSSPQTCSPQWPRGVRRGQRLAGCREGKRTRYWFGQTTDRWWHDLVDVQKASDIQTEVCEKQLPFLASSLTWLQSQAFSREPISLTHFSEHFKWRVSRCWHCGALQEHADQERECALLSNIALRFWDSTIRKDHSGRFVEGLEKWVPSAELRPRMGQGLRLLWRMLGRRRQPSAE